MKELSTFGCKGLQQFLFLFWVRLLSDLTLRTHLDITSEVLFEDISSVMIVYNF